MTDDPLELSNRFPAAPKYLMQVWLAERAGERAGTSKIAGRLGVSPAAVTQSLQRLARGGLLEQRPSRGFILTDLGRPLAERIVRRHFLLERLLADELGAPWDVADEEAELLQRSLSSRLEASLFERLGRPETCPHGNPFPGAPSEARLLALPRLADLPAGTTGPVRRVTEEGEMMPGLLAFCVDAGIVLGTTLRVVRSLESPEGDGTVAGDLQVEVVDAGHGDTLLVVPGAFSEHICLDISI